jgi:hypothetical protein
MEPQEWVDVIAMPDSLVKWALLVQKDDQEIQVHKVKMAWMVVCSLAETVRKDHVDLQAQ